MGNAPPSFRRWPITRRVFAGCTSALALVWIASVWWSIGLWVAPFARVSVVWGSIAYTEHDPRAFDSVRPGKSIAPAMGRTIWPRMDWWFAHRAGGYWEAWSAPLWPALLLGIAMILSHSRWRRPSRTRCECCAYDLRGLPNDTVCPECGSTISADQSGRGVGAE